MALHTMRASRSRRFSLFLLSCFLRSGGALTTIQVQREFHKNALRYDAIARRLTMLIRQMKASRTPDTSGNLLKEAYTLITSENQDWRITLIVRQLHPA